MNRSPGISRPPARPLAYLPQLDAVRAFAVGLVLWSHWCGAEDVAGPIGVWIFFVVSGFLITRILLNARGGRPHNACGALLNFYVRRALRIFPLYYFVLVLSFALSVRFRADWCWYALHLQNFRMMWVEEPTSIVAVHLWTLAVEQQFYFLWPLVVLFAPRVLVLPVIVSAMIAAVASRCAGAALGWTAFQSYVFTPNNLDTLGCGALLAWFVTHRPGNVIRLRRAALVGGFAILLAIVFLRIPPLGAGFTAMPTGLIALWLLSHVADGVRGPIGRLFSFPPSIYLGRISYGIYVYHFFVPAGLEPLLRPFHIERGHALFVAISFVVTVLIASASWFLMERPINSLKNKFHLTKRAARQEKSGQL